MEKFQVWTNARVHFLVPLNISQIMYSIQEFKLHKDGRRQGTFAHAQKINILEYTSIG